MFPESRNPPCVGDQVWATVVLLVTCTVSPHWTDKVRGENCHCADGSACVTMSRCALEPVEAHGFGAGDEECVGGGVVRRTTGADVVAVVVAVGAACVELAARGDGRCRRWARAGVVADAVDPGGVVRIGCGPPMTPGLPPEQATRPASETSVTTSDRPRIRVPSRVGCVRS